VKSELKKAFETEMSQAITKYYEVNYEDSFLHLERAHILGQPFVVPHTRSHWWMLKIGIRKKDLKEIFGQMARIIASLLISKIWVPIGNTGGANVSAIRPTPIPEDLKEVLGKEK